MSLPRKCLPAAAVLAVLAVAACGAVPAAGQRTGQAAVDQGTAGRVRAASPRPYGAADTAFGLRLLRSWCRGQPGSNIVFSPASLATGLGMAYLGARGATAAGMARVLDLPAAGTALQAGLRARWSALRALGGPGVTVAASNRVWADPSLPPLRSYLGAVDAGYGAAVRQVPLATDPAKAERVINAVVDSDTRGHIPDLIPPGALDGDRWVLTDALYLDAVWARPFVPAQTTPGRFATGLRTAVTALFLHGAGYRYASAAGWTAVALPYRGGRLAMTALLPPAAAAGLTGPASCVVPSAAALAQIGTRLHRAGRDGAGQAPRTGVALPKVSLSSREQLNGLLTGLGMGIAFTSAANFSGLSPQACCISAVEHAATLQVGEKGTVGSAATSVGVVPTDARVASGPQVVFDRPYLLLVTGAASGEPLFLARVADPAAR